LERNRRFLLDESFRPRLLRYFLKAPLTREDAEDLVQKTMLLVFQHVGELEQEERFVGWLYAIARNVKITELARRRAERRIVVGSADDAPAPRVAASGVEELAKDERRAAVRAAIETLPPRQRQCLLLRVRDELSYDEIASLLRLNLLTVRNHIAEGKKTLRELLGPDAGRVKT
jgi:RNA polymerase sigma-70 factor (ECF subfamily)